ncbi:hypothetical protein LOTGIDRAFT_164373 [Lottia gigantea]|uniref:3-hydroxyacyl-CoA dehydrogenase NAD binding domain-containing protein n=1 Tax=Lottia gigantea TaxID=225164 RepID=V4A4Z5_LOTGI|nr:hypothetical protein LOTGIDRAFT_164373 [Lottia gigantea]ESO90070.1 hypothetical protein LOTGIDRAFT_164373 [Lottia gigantea]
MVKVAIIGSGLMGSKIAGEMAYHGHRVKITDNNLDNLNKVFERLQEDRKMLKQDGLLPHDNFIGQVLCLSRLEETVSQADIIFECINEDLEAKKDIFRRISHLCKPDAIITTNTLRLDVTDITEHTHLLEASFMI